MTTNNHSANHERPPAQQERRNVLMENLLTIITIVGVIGEFMMRHFYYKLIEFLGNPLLSTCVEQNISRKSFERDKRLIKWSA